MVVEIKQANTQPTIVLDNIIRITLVGNRDILAFWDKYGRHTAVYLQNIDTISLFHY